MNKSHIEDGGYVESERQRIHHPKEVFVELRWVIGHVYDLQRWIKRNEITASRLAVGNLGR